MRQMAGAVDDYPRSARAKMSISAAHSWGGIVLHDVINNRFAHKAIEKGADGLIPVAAGAGWPCGRACRRLR